jgi:O-antigen ligase
LVFSNVAFGLVAIPLKFHAAILIDYSETVYDIVGNQALLGDRLSPWYGPAFFEVLQVRPGRQISP